MPRNKTRPPFIRITRAIVGESSKLYRCPVLPGARKNGISRFRHRDSFRRARRFRVCIVGTYPSLPLPACSLHRYFPVVNQSSKSRDFETLRSLETRGLATLTSRDLFRTADEIGRQKVQSALSRGNKFTLEFGLNRVRGFRFVLRGFIQVYGHACACPRQRVYTLTSFCKLTRKTKSS